MSEYTVEWIMQLDKLGLVEAVKASYAVDDLLEGAKMRACIEQRAVQIHAKTLVASIVRTWEKSRLYASQVERFWRRYNQHKETTF